MHGYISYKPFKYLMLLLPSDHRQKKVHNPLPYPKMNPSLFPSHCFQEPIRNGLTRYALQLMEISITSLHMRLEFALSY